MAYEVDTGSLTDTRRVGECLGRVLCAGDVVLLHGDLGAGKTSFTQGLARGLGVPRGRRVASPTFALVSEHPGRVPLYHVDLYRIDDPAELDQIGVREYLEGQGVAVVEWAERLGPHLPIERLEVSIAITGPRTRRLAFEPVGARARVCLERMARP